MISYIQGKILKLDFFNVLVLTQNGIGYEVLINELTYGKILDEKEIELFVYHHLTENNQTLFGFLEYEDRELFKELIKISGVGGKVAQNLLSLGTNNLKKAIIEENKILIENIKGIGKKMAQKIVLELKDKDIVKNILVGNDSKNELKNNNLEASLRDEITSSLVSMGYNSKKVDSILSTLPEDLKTLEDILPYVLKNI